MFDLLLFCDLKTVDKNFGLGLRDNEELFSFFEDRAVAFAYTKGINLNIILFDFAGTDWRLSIFESIEQEAGKSRIFWDIDNVRIFRLFLKVVGHDGQTCIF